jgi:dinuclear metal center YbgI/SA1388 family protein
MKSVPPKKRDTFFVTGTRGMTLHDLHTLLSTWAPKDIAWERDNVGLQVGEITSRVTGILVCLDVTEKVIEEARKRRANVILSHHPLLFRPPKTITPNDHTGRCIRALVAQAINLYSAHTNLDFTAGGTSFALAEALGLKDVDFLHTSYRVQKKIVTFVPEAHVEKVRDAMAAAGAGVIGNYDHCSFGTIGAGSFRGNKATTPAIGKKGVLEHVSEVRLEMLANQWDVPGVVRAMKAAHPYEEVAYDVYPLDNTSSKYGMGIIGTLKKPMRLERFLDLLKKRLHTKALRCTASPVTTIRRVAACGGAGVELVSAAVAQNADAFITADVKYHDFHDATGKILLIDAGHYETEHPVVNAVVRKLQKDFADRKITIPVTATKISTNPILYY